MAVVYAQMRSSSVIVGQWFKHRSTFYESDSLTFSNNSGGVGLKHTQICIHFCHGICFSVPSCYQHIKWYIRLLGLAQKVGLRFHIPGVRFQSEGIRMRDSWWTKWQCNRFLFRVLLFLPVIINSELTLLVAREDFIKQVSPTIWSVSFPLSRFLCFF